MKDSRYDIIKRRDQIKLKTIKESYIDTFATWPLKYRYQKKQKLIQEDESPLQKMIQILRPNEVEPETYVGLSDGVFDLTEQALDTERDFRPIIKIRTNELDREVDRYNLGGGTLFRVVGDEPGVKESTKLCLQYLIVWTQQLFPIRYFYLYRQMLFLSFCFLASFSNIFSLEQYDSFNTLIFCTLIVPGLIFLIGGFAPLFEQLRIKIRQRRTREVISPRFNIFSTLGFIMIGFLFCLLAVEYGTKWVINSTKFLLYFPWSAWISLLLAILIFTITSVIYLTKDSRIKRILAHPMDYAPLFIYLKKQNKKKNSRWIIDGAHFDKRHYRTDFLKKDSLCFDKEIPNRPSFIIDKAWHAFKCENKRFSKIREIISQTGPIFNYILYIPLYASLFLYLVFIIFKINRVDFLNLYLVFIGISFFIPIILIGLFWIFNSLKEFKLAMWDSLSIAEPNELMLYHHLSDDKLRVLWNLQKPADGDQESQTKKQWIKKDKARLIARIKLQYPFVDYQNWTILEDTEEDSLSLIYLQRCKRHINDLRNDIESTMNELAKLKSEMMNRQSDIKLIDFKYNKLGNKFQNKINTVLKIDKKMDEINQKINETTYSEDLTKLKASLYDIALNKINFFKGLLEKNTDSEQIAVIDYLLLQSHNYMINVLVNLILDHLNNSESILNRSEKELLYAEEQRIKANLLNISRSLASAEIQLGISCSFIPRAEEKIAELDLHEAKWLKINVEAMDLKLRRARIKVLKGKIVRREEKILRARLQLTEANVKIANAKQDKESSMKSENSFLSKIGNLYSGLFNKDKTPPVGIEIVLPEEALSEALKDEKKARKVIAEERLGITYLKRNHSKEKLDLVLAETKEIDEKISSTTDANTVKEISLKKLSISEALFNYECAMFENKRLKVILSHNNAISESNDYKTMKIAELKKVKSKVKNVFYRIEKILSDSISTLDQLKNVRTELENTLDISKKLTDFVEEKHRMKQIINAIDNYHSDINSNNKKLEDRKAEISQRFNEIKDKLETMNQN